MGFKGKVVSPAEIRTRLTPLYGEEGLRLVLLFGSLARGKTHRESDIDLAFLFDRDVDMVELTARVIELLSTDAVDVVELRKASPLLKFSIAKDAIVLYASSPSIFSEFYALSFRMFMDARKFYKIQHRAIREFIEVEGR